jgi:uncharacterized protein YjdB
MGARLRINAKRGWMALVAIVAMTTACSDESGNGPTGPVQVSSVRVTPKDGVWTGTLKVGQSVALDAKAIGSNGSEMPAPAATWSSSDTAIAIVNAAGNVVARSVGTAEVRAVISGRTGRINVTVTADAPPPATVAEVRVSPAAVVLALGETRQYSARAYDAAGIELFGRTVVWSTTTPQTISITAGGLVRALASGIGEVRATIEGRVGGVALTVATPEPVRAVRVEPMRIAVFTGQTGLLAATVLGANNQPLPGRTVTWESEDPSIAQVGIHGMVLGVRKGSVRIRATSGGVTGWAMVDVRNLPTSAQQTYDLVGSANMPSGYIQIGEDTWRDAAGTVHDVFLIVRALGTTMKIDLDAGTYVQTWIVELYVRNGQPNTTPVHTMTVVDQGRFVVDAGAGLPVLRSNTTPGAVYPVASARTGEYMIPQPVLGTYAHPWVWVIR